MPTKDLAPIERRATLGRRQILRSLKLPQDDGVRGGRVRHFWVYILTNKSQTLYVGITNDLDRRLDEHRRGVGSAFTSKYRCHTLVWHRRFNDPSEAIAMEKRIKGWTRAKKIALIEEMNPIWRDLSLPDETPQASSF